LAIAACNTPALFSSLILLDPIIIQPKQFHEKTIDIRFSIFNSIQRRNEWPSEADMRDSFGNSPFFKAWDPAALQLYMECATVRDERGVRLKMTGIQEGILFAECRSPYDAFEGIKMLDEKIELLWVFPGDCDGVAGMESTQVRAWLRPNNASNVRILGSQHLIAQYAPRELGNVIRTFLHRKYGAQLADNRSTHILNKL
jgi:hypothetical protein